MKDDNHPFLAYSTITSIEDSSEPFRAFLGAILFVVKGVVVGPSTFDPAMEFDTIEEEDPGVLSENDIDGNSGAYRGRLSTGTPRGPPSTRNRATESGLMARPSLY